MWTSQEAHIDAAQYHCTDTLQNVYEAAIFKYDTSIIKKVAFDKGSHEWTLIQYWFEIFIIIRNILFIHVICKVFFNIWYPPQRWPFMTEIYQDCNGTQSSQKN
jgi:hypothetical protein